MIIVLKKNYKALLSNNLMLNDEIEKKINLKNGSKAKKTKRQLKELGQNLAKNKMKYYDGKACQSKLA
jgi:hypothetical protein